MENQVNTGGSAFPSSGVVYKLNENFHHQGAYEGMTLRDYFAAKAMQAVALRALDETKLNNKTLENASYFAYAMADAMLNAREEQICKSQKSS